MEIGQGQNWGCSAKGGKKRKEKEKAYKIYPYTS
jgi:hypothetical protein